MNLSMKISWKNRRTLTFAALAAVLVASGGALAHDPKPRYGGRVEHAGNFHVEFVAKGKAVEAYLLGHDDKPMKADGYKGVAIIVIGGKSERIPLTVADSKDGNRLTGEAPIELPAAPRGVVQITNPAGTAASARFN
jgi:hypothetical protein